MYLSSVWVKLESAYGTDLQKLLEMISISAAWTPSPATQRSNVGHARGDPFWPAARNFVAYNFKGTTAFSQIKRKKIEAIQTRVLNQTFHLQLHHLVLFPSPPQHMCRAKKNDVNPVGGSDPLKLGDMKPFPYTFITCFMHTPRNKCCYVAILHQVERQVE